MSIPSSRKTWLLENKPEGDVKLSGDDATFKLETQDLPKLKDNQVLVKVTYISNDPAQRGWIDPNIVPERLYRPPVKQGATMEARCLGEVIESTSEKYKKGQNVQGSFGWADYVVNDASDPGLRPAPDLPGGLSISHYLGALGATGITAYYGLAIIAEAKKGESVLVSGAAGATGSMVVQIAKHILGASRVIGIAGSDDKCKWVESIGADRCLNYKSSSFEKDLQAAAEGGFDVFFDNVGGEILDMALLNLKQHGRVAACGAIAGYNSGNAWTSKNYFQIITMRLQLRGFIVMDYLHKAGEVIGIFKKALEEGKLKISGDNETVVDTKFEDVPKTWTMLFEGGNTGKLVTKLIPAARSEHRL